jgi:hypothetical protein
MACIRGFATAALFGALAAVGCRRPAPGVAITTPRAGSRYLFVWAGDRARRTSDLLAVLDVDPRSPTYATVVATLPVGATGTIPHHTEHEMPDGGELWANGFGASRTFRLDLRDPGVPRLAGEVADAAPYAFPHSFVRLPNGHVLATYQLRLADSNALDARNAPHEHDGGANREPLVPATRPSAPRGTTGGLAEFDAGGRLIRVASASSPSDSAIRPYSLAVLPALDRVVTTATDMFGALRSRTVQVWRLSDLRLLASILLPPGARGDEQWNAGEPRALADGRTVLVGTFTCGLYRLSGLEGERPSVEWVHSGAYDSTERAATCALAVVAGRFWLQASGTEHAIISLDVSDPSHPKEVGRLAFGNNEFPHWIALEPSGRRLVVTGNGALRGWVVLARMDPQSGAVTLDSSFRAPGATRPGIDFGALGQPHGDTVSAVPHGAVFSRP